jgi:hypothetical protein
MADVKYYYLFLVFFYLNSVKRVNNVKLSIELNYTKLKESFLKKEKKITVFNSDYI